MKNSGFSGEKSSIAKSKKNSFFFFFIVKMNIKSNYHQYRYIQIWNHTNQTNHTKS